MIIRVVHIGRMAILKSERDAPVSRHGDGIVPAKLSSKLVESKSREVHVSRLAAAVKHGEDIPQLSDVVRSNPP